MGIGQGKGGSRAARELQSFAVRNYQCSYAAPLMLYKFCIHPNYALAVLLTLHPCPSFSEAIILFQMSHIMPVFVPGLSLHSIDEMVCDSLY